MAGREAYDTLAGSFLGEPGVTESQMFGMPCLKVGGKVFAGLWREELVLKLPRERVAELTASGAGAHFDPGMGRVMKEWVLIKVPESAWRELAQEASGSLAPIPNAPSSAP